MYQNIAKLNIALKYPLQVYSVSQTELDAPRQFSVFDCLLIKFYTCFESF